MRNVAEMIQEVKDVVEQQEQGLIADCEFAVKLINLAGEIGGQCQCGTDCLSEDLGIRVRT